jgi:thioredoxin 1
MNKIIKFSAAWCGPCKAMAPQFKKFQEAHINDSVEIVDVDVDQNYELASEYGVRSIPYTVFIKEGEVVDRISGMANFDKLNEKYNETYLAVASA